MTEFAVSTGEILRDFVVAEKWRLRFCESIFAFGEREREREKKCSAGTPKKCVSQVKQTISFIFNGIMLWLTKVL